MGAASFAPDDENDLLVVDKRGLVCYSLTTGETVVLRPDINAECFRLARFSPDGRSLALYEEGSGIPTVYLFDVAHALAAGD